MSLTYDIVLIEKTHITVNIKLKTWRQILNSKWFRKSRFKTEYLRCKFNNETYKIGVKVRLDLILKLSPTVKDLNIWGLKSKDMERSMMMSHTVLVRQG